MLRRHFVGNNPLPQITLVGPATDDRRAGFPTAKRSLGVTKIELAFGIHSAVAFEAAVGKDRGHVLVKIGDFRRGAVRLRHHLGHEKQCEKSPSPWHNCHLVIPTYPSTIRGG